MPTYRLKQIEDYWIIISDELAKIGEVGVILSTDKDKYVKVIAQSRMVHEGIALFELPEELQGDDIKNMAKKYAGNPLWLTGMEEGFRGGYNAAKEKYRFTEDQVRKAFIDGMALVSFGEVKEDSVDTYIQSLNKPKQYEAEIEMEEFVVAIDLYDEKITQFRPKLTNGKVTITKVKEV